MKKITFFLLVLVCLPFVAAQEDYSIKNQWYEVVYDETNVATVSAVFNIFNNGASNQSLENFKVQISSSAFEILEIVQTVGSGKQCRQVCSQYEQVCQGTEVVCSEFNQATQTCSNWQERCTGYQTVCNAYTEECYDGYGSDYYRDFKLLDKNSVQRSGDIYEIPIEPILPRDSSKILIRYKLRDTTKSFLYTSFRFETIKVPVVTENLRVAVNTDEDVHMAGIAWDRSFSPFGGAIASVSSRALNSISTEERSDYLSQINRVTYVQGYVKERRNLDPGNGISVKGKYSTSFMRLYFLETLLFLGLTIFSLVLLTRKWTSLEEKHQISLDVKKYKDLKDFHIWRSIGLSFLSMFLFVLFAVISLFMNGTYLSSILFSLGVIGLLGTLIYTKKIHSTKEMMASIGFFCIWILVLPVAMTFLVIAIAVIYELSHGLW